MTRTAAEIKAGADRLRQHLFSKHNLKIGHAHALEAAAAYENYPNWDTASAALKSAQVHAERAGVDVTGVSIRKKVYAALITEKTTNEALVLFFQKMSRCDPDKVVFLSITPHEVTARSDWERLASNMSNSGMLYEVVSIDPNDVAEYCSSLEWTTVRL